MAQGALSRENKAIVRRALEALMSGNCPEGTHPLDELLTPDCALHQCGFLEPIRGASGIRALPRSGPLTNRQVQLEQIVGEDDMVAIHWKTTARYTDPDEPEIDGSLVSFPAMSFVRLEGGKIAEIWNIADVATLQTKLRDLRETQKVHAR